MHISPASLHSLFIPQMIPESPSHVGTTLGTGDITVNKIGQNPHSDVICSVKEAMLLWGNNHVILSCPGLECSVEK